MASLELAERFIRPAKFADCPVINDIYNYYVIHSTATYQTVPETMAAREEWFAAHGPMHPLIVYETDGEILGWGSLSPFRTREAYRRTVENSVYLRHDRLGKGIGSLLLKKLIDLARDAGHHVIIAGIDAEQSASIKLHAKFGFVQAGHFHQVGYKFERWLDVIFMEKMLAEVP